jgi:endothelin-converting enzyme/putative endopeptidase
VRKYAGTVSLLLALCGLAAGGGMTQALLAAQDAGPPPAAPAYRDGIDLAAIDRRVNACDNFYRHACGGFIASARVDADEPEIRMADSRFDANLERALGRLFRETGNDPELDRLKTFYESCTASAAGANQADTAIVRAWLARIDGVQSRADVQAMLRDLSGIGVDVFLNYGGWPDRTDWGGYRGELTNGRTWSEPAVVEQAFTQAGLDPAAAHRDAEAVVAIATALRPRTVRRWDDGTEHPMTPAAIAAAYPGIDWAPYFRMIGATADRPINVTSPAYLEALQSELATRPVAELRAYLRWQFLFSLRGELPAPYNGAFGNIDPGYRVATGNPTKACRDATVRAMGVEFSRQFATRILGREARDAGSLLADSIRDAMVRSIGDRDWLSPEARQATADKLRQTDLKIGFPDDWPEAGRYPVRAGHFLDNVLAARRYEQQRTWSRAHARRDRRAWDMIVYPWVGEGMAAARLPIPNGFPDAFTNSLIMTAAYLMPPRFDAAVPPEVNYGTFGAVFGHELVHVAQLHMFGADGRERELWGAADQAAETRQGQCVIDQANAHHPLPGVSMDGTRQYEENVADYGGLRLAYEALRARLGAAIDRPDASGTTPAQRFFYAFAQNWCTAQTDDSLRGHVASDGHGPPEFRVNGPLSNLPAFARAFGCGASAPMVRPAANQCVVW